MSQNSNVHAEQGQPLVRLRNLSMNFGSVAAVRGINLDVFSRDFLAILGPSGCGKTTLLRMIGGFIEPSSGKIEIDGADVTHLGPERRPTNMVFQGYGLFPHMSVRQNVGYGLRIAKVPQDESEARVAEVLDLVRLRDLAERGVEQLSGGQQQRIALARALVMQPKVLLLDEPLAALDLKLRQAMQEELRRIRHEVGGTFVFVTHDQGEALGLANRIAVMESGCIVQEGSPQEIYTQPSTRFVSTFIGEANLFPGECRGGQIILRSGVTFDAPGPDARVLVVVRPEDMRIGADARDSDIVMQGVLYDIVYLGAFVRYQVRLSDGQSVMIHSIDRTLQDTLFPGAEINFGWSSANHGVIPDD